MPSRIRQTRAFLLRSIDYRDSDRVVTLLTEDFGKVAALARGARKSKRRFGGALQPYVLINAHLRSGRGELAHLDRVSVDESFLNILRDLSAMASAGTAMASIRERLPDGEPEPKVFADAVRFFQALNTGAPPDESLITLQVRVLADLGFAPTLDQCVRCAKAPPSGRSAQFDPAQGGIVCRACGGGRIVLGAATLRRWMNAQVDEEFPQEAWPDKELQQLRKALELLDQYHATVTVRERTVAAVPAWRGRAS